MVRVAEGVPTLKEVINQSVRFVTRVEAASNLTTDITRAHVSDLVLIVMEVLARVTCDRPVSARLYQE